MDVGDDIKDEDFDDWLAQAFGSGSEAGTFAAGRAAPGEAEQQHGGRHARRGPDAAGEQHASHGGSGQRTDDAGTEATSTSLGHSAGGQSAGGRARLPRSGRRGPAASGGGAGGQETAQQRAHRLFYERKKERLSILLADVASRRAEAAKLTGDNDALRRRAAALELMLAGCDRHIATVAALPGPPGAQAGTGGGAGLLGQAGAPQGGGELAGAGAVAQEDAAAASAAAATTAAAAAAEAAAAAGEPARAFDALSPFVPFGQPRPGSEGGATVHGSSQGSDGQQQPEQLQQPPLQQKQQQGPASLEAQRRPPGAPRSHSADAPTTSGAAAPLAAPVRSYSADWATLPVGRQGLSRLSRPPTAPSSAAAWQGGGGGGGEGGAAPGGSGGPGGGGGAGGGGQRRPRFLGYQVTTEGPGLIRTSSTGSGGSGGSGSTLPYPGVLAMAGSDPLPVFGAGAALRGAQPPLRPPLAQPVPWPQPPTVLAPPPLQPQPQAKQAPAPRPPQQPGQPGDPPAERQPAEQQTPAGASAVGVGVPPISSPPARAAGVLGWYRNAVSHLAALLRASEAPGPAGAEAAAELGVAVDTLLDALHRLAARNRAGCCALMCSNLETGAPAAPSDAHWRSALAAVGLAPAQRARALDCYTVFAARAAGRAADKEAVVRELRRLAADPPPPQHAYHPAAAALSRLLAADHAAAASLACALRSVMSRPQIARWCVHSWPFAPSPVDLLAALEDERARVALAPPPPAAGGAGAGLAVGPR